MKQSRFKSNNKTSMQSPQPFENAPFAQNKSRDQVLKTMTSLDSRDYKIDGQSINPSVIKQSLISTTPSDLHQSSVFTKQASKNKRLRLKYFQNPHIEDQSEEASQSQVL